VEKSEKLLGSLPGEGDEPTRSSQDRGKYGEPLGTCAIRTVQAGPAVLITGEAVACTVGRGTGWIGSDPDPALQVGIHTYRAGHPGSAQAEPNKVCSTCRPTRQRHLLGSSRESPPRERASETCPTHGAEVGPASSTLQRAEVGPAL
jgi:hypothetical protein